MNTKISYTYRDADNYKQFMDIIIPEEITDQQKNLILSKLDENLYFIPSQVGLTDLQEMMIAFPNDSDHVWHELHRDDISLTDEAPTDWAVHKFGDISGLVRRFEELENWDITEASKKIRL